MRWPGGKPSPLVVPGVVEGYLAPLREFGKGGRRTLVGWNTPPRAAGCITESRVSSCPGDSLVVPGAELSVVLPMAVVAKGYESLLDRKSVV